MKVNVGDKVILHGKWSGNYVRTVEKITPKGYIIVEGKTFYEDGNQRGGDTWSKYWISEATPEAIQSIKDTTTIKKAVRICHSITSDDINIDIANQLIELLGNLDC